MTTITERIARLNAEGDAADAPMPPCPDWCTMRPGHHWSAYDHDGTSCRGHDGPRFGIVYTGADEREDSSAYAYFLDLDLPAGGLTPVTATQLAADLLRAAAWTGDHQDAARAAGERTERRTAFAHGLEQGRREVRDGLPAGEWKA